MKSLKKTHLLIFLFLPFYMFSQTENDKIIYLDSLFSITTKENHIYYKVVKDYYFQKESYLIEYYYKSGKLKKTATSKESDTNKYFGFVTSYYENGTASEKLFYKDSQPNGPYRSWYINGKKKAIGEYIATNGDAAKATILKIDQYWDENSVQKVIDGEGTYLEQSGKLSLEGKVKNGLKDGVWKGKDDRQYITFEEEYQNGEFISGVSTDINFIKHTYKQIQQNPSPIKGLNHFYTFVSKKFNIRGNYNGRAKIILTFEVDKKGTINNVEIVTGVNPTFDKEAIRVLNAYADWQPGKYRGVDANVLFTLPIVLDLK